MSQKLIDALEAFSESIQDIVANHRDGGEKPAWNQVKGDFEPASAARREVEADPDAPADDDTVEVSYGDLWRLVNRSRKMIRLAREGKVPSQEQRAPLCRAIKALKGQGVVQKPRNPRD